MKTTKYNLGVVSVSFRQHTPYEILSAMKEAGLSCIEWGSDVHAPCHNTVRLKELSELQKEYGISCSSYGTYFRLGETPTAELEQYISAAKILGTDTLRLWCGHKSGSDMTRDEKEFLLNQCRIAANIAKKHGGVLCMECHKKTYTQRLEDALDLMREVPDLKMYWQPFQWKEISDNLDYAEKIAPFTRHIHVFQWKGDVRFSLSEGINEWREYLSKFSLPRTLLLEFMPDGKLSSLSKEVKALRTIIGE